ncbi:efflux RND transporter periplasmic adaptor subunit [Kyrpidia tusciae]|uniref:Secretion protein HlyD family protein n=1 Tax=Kyrpidia tusciae (strain DSM 2912 / NBRC 15312 / T2) TaxID=562970 RepID=D5WWL4_KYRT2|nr:HlyD family efflux transporter periplasmic adaptor subunit [Kyrpidia tusciae]ADG07779.1 secretion protein HlyD family protein [Kyrpidia tusciae DSM 2912]
MKRKIILIILVIAIVVGGGGIGAYYWYQASHYVTTDDARIDGDIYRVMPRTSGKLTSLNIREGDYVVADQIVGQQDVSNLPNSLLDNALLRAPASGTVIKTLAKVGEVVSPGQPVALIVNKKNLYVEANIEETNLGKIRLGEPVDFTVDSFPGLRFTGRVMDIGQATNSTFSAIPALNTSGNFTKVTQRIPIKISIDDQHGADLSPGMSAEIRIHIKG